MASSALPKISFKYFFDKPAVKRATDKGTRKALSKWGAFVMRAARTSIRKRKKSSAPGQPPSSHQGSLKKLIFFVFVPQEETTYVGPVVFKKGEAPALLEYKGTIRRRGKTYRYKGNPFIRPAEEKTRSKLPEIWANSIK